MDQHRHFRAFATLSSAIAMIACAPAFAQEASISMDAIGKSSASLNDVSIVTMVEGNGEYSYKHSVSVAEKGEPQLRFDPSGGEASNTFLTAKIVEMDPANDTPEVVTFNWTGGAHCCNAITVATKTPSGWNTVDVGAFDGDQERHFPQDIDSDGRFEIRSVDNNFLYRFTSYAGSYAPPQIWGVEGGKVVNRSADPAFRYAMDEWLETTKPPEGDDEWVGESRNSYLAARAAVMALKGEGEKGLAEAITRHDPKATGGLTECPQKTSATGECPVAEVTRPYGDVLREFLISIGYAVPPQ
ncbi:hypothetical protein [Ahrensia sp. R2A130]|uniref:hypothetical protein n=1 Tax=Ahrensia sp. R2A130 TaxID=744979 RepID=UPI0001E0A4CC|nr:hypothetical protein [Ahrensia sp. R2A130]EFL88430.1 hypothetical protein R2A130_2950 [Ahrensia sp. R2A130]